MALKAVVAALTDVPEALRSLYEQKDGKFVLPIEGDVPGYVKQSEVDTLRNQHAEFRDSNRSLNAKVTELEGKLKPFEGLDPEKARTDAARLAEIEKKTGAKGADDIAAVIEKALEPVRTELKTIKQSEAQAKQELRQKELEGALTAAGLKAGVDEKALPDFLARGLRTFTVEDGKHVAKGADGTILRKSGDPVTPEQWAADLATEAPHLFKPSKGGGAAPSPGNGSAGTVRVIPEGTKLTAADIDALAKGEAVRATAAP